MARVESENDPCPPPWISSDMTYAEWIAQGKTDNPKEQTA